jgi:hypothetical protein
MRTGFVSLDLSRNTFNNDSIAALGEWMCRSKIKRLHVSGQPSAIKLNWDPILKNSKRIVDLNLSHQNIADQDCRLMADALSRNQFPLLQKLDLSWNAISNHGVAILDSIKVSRAILVQLKGNAVTKNALPNSSGLICCF